MPNLATYADHVEMADEEDKEDEVEEEDKEGLAEDADREGGDKNRVPQKYFGTTTLCKTL